MFVFTIITHMLIFLRVKQIFFAVLQICTYVSPSHMKPHICSPHFAYNQVTAEPTERRARAKNKNLPLYADSWIAYNLTVSQSVSHGALWPRSFSAAQAFWQLVQTPRYRLEMPGCGFPEFFSLCVRVWCVHVFLDVVCPYVLNHCQPLVGWLVTRKVAELSFFTHDMQQKHL